jgi:hypothetical protein
MSDLGSDGITETCYCPERDVWTPLSTSVLLNIGSRLHIFLRQLGLLTRPLEIGQTKVAVPQNVLQCSSCGRQLNPLNPQLLGARVAVVLGCPNAAM